MLRSGAGPLQLQAHKLASQAPNSMHLVLKSGERSLVSLSNDELLGIVNALNEVCNGVGIPDAAFSTRIGVDRAFLQDLQRQLLAQPPEQLLRYELVSVWAEPTSSVMVRTVTAFGDPVEMNSSEASLLVSQLQSAIEEAS